MSTIVRRQPSQPTIDSTHVVEATTMRLKLVSPKSHIQKPIFGLSNVLQSLSPSSHKSIDHYFQTETKNSYPHDEKSLKLSQKSLELCTESLGSETGSDTSEDDSVFAFHASVTRSRRDVQSKKRISRNFPPPLTTMSGSKPFQVRPHREGGRLIIEAMEVTLGKSCLQAERSDGRLRLTCWKNEEDDCDEESEENDIEMNDVENSEEEMEMEMERNVVVVENFQRLRRCNEDEHRDKGICSSKWEPSCWVATS